MGWYVLSAWVLMAAFGILDAYADRVRSIKRLQIILVFPLLLYVLAVHYGAFAEMMGWDWYWPISMTKLILWDVPITFLEDYFGTVVVFFFGFALAFGFGVRTGERASREAVADCPYCGRGIVVIAKSFPREDKSRMTVWTREDWADGAHLRSKPGMKV
jgi:hypothetical protein